MRSLRPFTHRVYVDFSGDDGDPRKVNASSSITAAWVISSEDMVYENEGIVLGIKRLIGCRPTDNLRYRSLKKHPKKEEALALLRGLKGKVILVPVVKRHIDDEPFRNPKTKRLVSILHTFPLRRVFDYLLREEEDPYIQLVLDEVAWALCKEHVRSTFLNDKTLDWSRARHDWLLFAKSGSSLMLQLADVFAGLGREYVESLPQELPPCRMCHVKRHFDCSYRRKGVPVGEFKLLRLLHPLLLRSKEGKAWEDGLIVRPPEAAHLYRFMDCLLSK